MFTVLWKLPSGGEELYVAPSVTLVPAAPPDTPSAELAHRDCRGLAHVVLRRIDGFEMERTLIDVGSVFVMNTEGRTVATYKF